ncbi:cytochrome c oxidase assembly protein [Aurantimonas sp. VKM B-3413]|uniref:cytochrome c oxidase assembly protein n=1 Tax=Aurantimonas sp. VKM B-3413 TaxID=2779401 RepID=UPI001E36F033|nr:cytochrome c oxidase assembly protein [Aurantimonas sp. VKM B-3413]MCB8837847.1 cytochrome c oxidase assembly protein [Aurantimonas sp. VKM B-3413]
MKFRLGRNAVVVGALSCVLAVMITLVSYAPTLYQLFCAATGYNGTVQRANAATAPKEASKKTVTVRFDANVAPGLDWEFRPEKPEIVTHYGEPTKTYYYAKNNSEHTIVAHALFNVTPYQAAPYFFKIECFCFTDEKLKPGESAKMPLVLFVDDQMAKDPTTASLESVTLSYTFFEQENPTPEQIAAARDLGTGSAQKDAELKKDLGKAAYANDAPRG